MSKQNDSSGLGVLIIIIGIVILLGNFDILKFSMFWGVVKLWPLIFVIIGVSMLFKSSKNIGIILWLIFFGVVIAYSFLNMDEKSWSLGKDVNNIYYEEDTIGNIGTGEIDIDIKQGSLNIKSSDINKIKYDIPEIGIKEATVESKLLRPTILKIYDEDIKSISSISNRKYNVEIPNDGKWALSIDAGVLSGKLDFSNTGLKDLSIDAGVLDTDLILSNNSEGSYMIDAGIGDFKIYIPKDSELGIKIKVDGGLKAVDIDEQYFTKNNDIYTSENYDSAKNKIDIDINIGIGNINVNLE